MNLESTFQEIEKALDYGLYTLAFSMVLTIPDICGALESGDGRASGSKYKKWYTKYAGDLCSLSGADCYYLRCAMLHQGRTQHMESKYNRVFFTPRINGNMLHNNSTEKNGEIILSVDLIIFCMGIINGARKWIKDNEGNPIYEKNVADSFRLHPNGFAPHIIGYPLFG